MCAAAILLVAQPDMPAAPPSPAHRTVLTRVSPLYPVFARRMQVAGIVTILAIVLPNGTVSEISVEAGHALLRQAALDTVRLWRLAADPTLPSASPPSTSDFPVELPTDRSKAD